VSVVKVSDYVTMINGQAAVASGSMHQSQPSLHTLSSAAAASGTGAKQVHQILQDIPSRVQETYGNNGTLISCSGSV